MLRQDIDLKRRIAQRRRSKRQVQGKKIVSNDASVPPRLQLSTSITWIDGATRMGSRLWMAMPMS